MAPDTFAIDDSTSPQDDLAALANAALAAATPVSSLKRKRRKPSCLQPWTTARRKCFTTNKAELSKRTATDLSYNNDR
jgi:hypothetical protein